MNPDRCSFATPWLLALAAAAACPSAWAGRPLATDDAGTTAAGTCQLESWIERAGSGGQGALVLAPACGLAADLELGFDYTRPRPRDTIDAAAGLALKWVPAAWRSETALGALNFGLKLSAGFERPAAGATGWRRSETAALAVATLAPADAWALHANLGAARDRASAASAALLNLGLVWSPRDDALVFTEVEANNRRTVFGGSVRSAGARVWLVKDRFGVDLTVSREAGVAATTRWSVGAGWYGLGL